MAIFYVINSKIVKQIYQDKLYIEVDLCILAFNQDSISPAWQNFLTKLKLIQGLGEQKQRFIRKSKLLTR